MPQSKYIPFFLNKSKPIFTVEDRGYKTPCWIWQRGTSGWGYGAFQLNGKQIRAHTWFYEHEFGRVPEGLELDHLCRVRNCVNPEHLEAVTHLENMRRGNAPTSIAYRTNRCFKGHALEGKNAMILKNGERRCRLCYNKYHREYQYKKRHNHLKDTSSEGQ